MRDSLDNSDKSSEEEVLFTCGELEILSLGPTYRRTNVRVDGHVRASRLLFVGTSASFYSLSLPLSWRAQGYRNPRLVLSRATR
jgi:hypothetical protein